MQTSKRKATEESILLKMFRITIQNREEFLQREGMGLTAKRGYKTLIQFYVYIYD